MSATELGAGSEVTAVEAGVKVALCFELESEAVGCGAAVSFSFVSDFSELESTASVRVLSLALAVSWLKDRSEFGRNELSSFFFSSSRSMKCLFLPR